MFCCSFCGVTAFGGQSPSAAKFTRVEPIPGFPAPPFAFSNMDMRPYMEHRATAKPGQPPPPVQWNQCLLCTEARKKGKLLHRMRYNVHLTQEYQRTLLACRPLDAQLLSVTDVTMTVKDRVMGHAKGVLDTQNGLLNTFLVSRGEGHGPSGVSFEVMELLGILKKTSPIVSKVKTLAERDIPGHGLPLLPPEAIADITSSVAARNPAYMSMDPDQDARAQIFQMLAVIDANPVVNQADPQQQPRQARPVFKVGKVTLRDTGLDVDLITNAAGLPIKAIGRRWGDDLDSSSGEEGSDDTPTVPQPFDTPAPETPSLELYLTLELAVFAACFPQGHGAYQEGQFAEYLRYRMSCGFSLFTLHKPYLMIMFLIRQCNLLHGACGENMLERDMKAYRKAHPGCEEEEVVRNALKYSVPNKIPGTPGWHYQALQDLLAMVQLNGMPQLFWTCTMDEVSMSIVPDLF